VSKNIFYVKNKLENKNRERATQIIDLENPLLKLLFEQGSDIVYLLDLSGNIITANPTVETLLGVKLNEMTGESFTKYIAEEDLEVAYKSFLMAIKGEAVNYELNLVDNSGNKVHVRTEGFPFVLDGEIVGVYGIVKDATTNTVAEELKDYYEEHDSLTKLPNLSNFCQTLASKIKKQDQNDFNGALLLVDIEQFELVNETLGIFVGDQLLKEVANRLVGMKYHVARLGNDQFIISLDGMSKKDEIVSMIKFIQERIKGPYNLSGHEYFLTSNIGVAVYPKDGTSPETLVKHALLAMQHAKKADEIDCYRFFKAEMMNNSFEQFIIKSKLKTALFNNEFNLNYQPRINTVTNEITGMEALLRWEHPIIGKVSPLSFIPVAEESGLIVPIGAWVLRTACRQNKIWQEKGLGNYRVSVNVSAKQLQQSDFIEVVLAILEETELEAKWLELEITESMIMQNDKRSITVLKRLKDKGIKVAIDDFGTGYSSLSYLRDFPVDILKIDKSFIDDIMIDQQENLISKAIISLGHNLGMEVVAEGVENPLQLTFLRALNCTEAQGYLFSEPLTTEKFTALLEGEGSIPHV
jgi:diguanylate cyclase (GGDEF)-like protein/PAS domain S-box-containing protein